MVISFLGVRTDTVLESPHGNMSAHKKFHLKTQNLWLAVDPYMPPRRTGMHKMSERDMPGHTQRIDGHAGWQEDSKPSAFYCGPQNNGPFEPSKQWAI